MRSGLLTLTAVPWAAFGNLPAGANQPCTATARSITDLRAATSQASAPGPATPSIPGRS